MQKYFVWDRQISDDEAETEPTHEVYLASEVDARIAEITEAHAAERVRNAELRARVAELEKALYAIVLIADNDEQPDCYEHKIARRALGL